MLVYLLAIAVAIGSLSVFLAAFFVPEIHRQNDFLWSGVGLLYALVLWVTAEQIGGGLLLGQAAGVVFLEWAILQMLRSRWLLVPTEQRSAQSITLVRKLADLSTLQTWQTIIKNLQIQLQSFGKKTEPPAPKPPVTQTTAVLETEPVKTPQPPIDDPTTPEPPAPAEATATDTPEPTPEKPGDSAQTEG